MPQECSTEGCLVPRHHFTPSNPISTELTTTLTFDHIFQSQKFGKCDLAAL